MELGKYGIHKVLSWLNGKGESGIAEYIEDKYLKEEDVDLKNYIRGDS